MVYHSEKYVYFYGHKTLNLEY